MNRNHVKTRSKSMAELEKGSGPNSRKRPERCFALLGPNGASHYWGLTPFPATHMKNKNALMSRLFVDRKMAVVDFQVE